MRTISSLLLPLRYILFEMINLGPPEIIILYDHKGNTLPSICVHEQIDNSSFCGQQKIPLFNNIQMQLIDEYFETF